MTLRSDSMRFARRRSASYAPDEEAEDPLVGLANLFDVSLAFIVALLLALFSLFSAVEFLDPDSNVTVVREDSDGNVEIVEKRGERIEVKKVTDDTLSGEGVRLGTAYRLASGEVVYVPEGAAPSP